MDFLSEYISIGCNRFSNIADVHRPEPHSAPTAQETIVFGAGRYIALWNTSANKGIHATLVGHTAQVSTLKFLPQTPSQPSAFISGDEDGTVKIWKQDEDVIRGYLCIQTLKNVHVGSVSAIGVISGEVANDQKDKIFVTGGCDAVVKVWRWNESVEGFELSQTIDLDGKLPLDFALARLPESEALILAMACTNRKLHIYISPSVSYPFTRSLMLEGHEDWIRCLSFTNFPSREDSSSDDKEDLMLASGSQDGFVRLWRVARLIETGVRGYEVEKEMMVQPEAVDDNGLNDQMLDDFERRMTGDVAGGSGTSGQNQLSTKAHIVRVDDSHKYGISLEALLIGHEGWISNLHWSPSTLSKTNPAFSIPQLLSTSADNSMIIWSPEETSSVWYARSRFGEMSGKGLGLFGALWTVVPQKEGVAEIGVIANGWNGGFHRWISIPDKENQEHEQYNPAWAITGHALAIKDMTWDPASEYLISVSTDQTTRIHASCRPSAQPNRAKRWGELGRPQIHGYDMTCVAPLSRTRFISGADEKVVRVFDAPRGYVASMSALGVTEEDLHAESRSVGASVPPLGLSNRALSKAVDPSFALEDKGFNQEHISISDELFDLPSEAVLSSSTLWPEIEKLYGHGYELITAATSPSGKTIATACKATTSDHAVIRLYNTDTWKQVGKPLSGHNLTITNIAFSPDEQFILSCSRDRTWRIFGKVADGEGYEPVAADRPHSRIIWDCAWSPDGSYFATASRDKTVKIWKAQSTTPLRWTLQSTLKMREAATAVAICRGEGLESDLLAVGMETGAVEIYRIQSGDISSKAVAVLPDELAHVDQIHRLLWSQRDGALLLTSCSEDRSLKICNLQLKAKDSTSPGLVPGAKLSLDEYKRYGRQMILPGFGLPGQLALKEASVAVVGAGGLGCPALQYLVGAGVGQISIFDFDKVEVSNLHRQVLHTSDRVGEFKAESAKLALQSLNPHVRIDSVTIGISPANAIEKLRGHSIALDCTDRPQTRYLISDASVKLDIPLVSGAAIGHSGQWAVYGGRRRKRSSDHTTYNLERRGCYRCIWPKPVVLQNKAGAGTCEEEGVWGPVTGIVGAQMAAEAIKTIVGMHDQESRLHLMSLDPSFTPFRSIKIRGPSPSCIACGSTPTITDNLEDIDYETFCGVSAQGEKHGNLDRISVHELQTRLRQTSPTLLVDTRESTEYGICSLPGSVNIPLERILANPVESISQAARSQHHAIVFICRKGNDSQLSSAALSSALGSGDVAWDVQDVVGGLQAWSREIDPEFPIY